MIKDLAGFDAAIRSVCPIDGVSADGSIFFSTSATPLQITAANAAAAAFVDSTPQLLSIRSVLAALTDAEYIALMQAATAQIATRPGIHRAMFGNGSIDLSKPAVQNMITQIVNAGILTAARAAAVFVAPPPPAPPATLPS